MRLAPDSASVPVASTTARLPLPPPGPVPPWARPPVVDALLLLGNAAGLELSRAEIERQLTRAAVPGRSVMDAFTSAGEELGMRMRVLELPSTELGGPTTAGLYPAVAFDPNGRPVVVVGASHAHASVVDPGSDDPPRPVPLDALGIELGAQAASVPVRWVVADPKRGLQTIGSSGHGGDHDDVTPERRLWELLRLEKDDVWVAVVYAAGVGILSIATPLGVQFLVNTVAFGALVQPLVVLTLMVFAGLLFAGMLRLLQAYVIERLQQRVFARVALDLAHRFPRVRVEALDGQHGPELANRFFDVVTLQKGAQTLLVDGISIVLQTLVGLVLLAFYHPFLLAFDAFLLGSLAIIIFVLGRGGPVTSIKESKKKYELAAWLQETVRHVHTFKLQGGQDYAHQKAEALTRDYVAARRKHFKIVYRQFAAALVVEAIASAILLGVGGALVIGQRLTLGQLVAAELIVTAVVAGFSKLGKYFETYYDLLAAVDKIGHLVDLPVEPGGGIELPPAPVGLDIRAASVSVHREGREVLRDVNLVVTAGSRAAIFAVNGRGKSVLVDVLFGLRTPSSGRIDVDGIDGRELSATSLRRSFALLREPDVFEGTIAENVILGRPEVTRHDVRQALESVGVWDFITALPDGLDTHIATRGVGMPSGFITLLLVARAIAGRPRAIVLDGILDTLDAGARESVQRAIAALQPRCSVIVTTTDPSVLSWCGHGYVLDGGTLHPATSEDRV